MDGDIANGTWPKIAFQNVFVSCVYMYTVGLVVLTEMAGYAIAPGAMQLSTFLWAGLGTGLCSSSANAFNQVCVQ